MLSRIVSGGQTGVDRAALDAAIVAGLPVGGWCPRGRRAEDGAIAAQYPLAETPDDAYATRTDWNVRDSDGTLILNTGVLEGGTKVTADLAAEKYRRPLMIVDLDRDTDPSGVLLWLAQNRIATLNVAGPRESKRPGIYRRARAWLGEALKALSS